MLDLKRIRENPEAIRKGAGAKGEECDIDGILELDSKRRELLQKVEALKAERNKGSKEIGKLKRAGEDTSELEARMRSAGEEVKKLDAEIAEAVKERDDLLAWVPNVPAPDVPAGDESANVEVRSWVKKASLDFEP